MRSVTLGHAADFAGWRAAARVLLAGSVPPEEVVWQAGAAVRDLFGEPADGADGGAGEAAVQVRVPRLFVELAERVACHRDPGRFALLYRVLWRLAHGERALLGQASDTDVYRLLRYERAVSRECHKLHAFVRFRRLRGVEPERYVAWFEPEHPVLRLASGFFQRRFATMRWSILTPETSAHWDTHELVFGRGGPRGDASSAAEPLEELWRTYFANTFNPARLRLDAMRSEMPVRYWKNLPEASLIAPLVHAAGPRVAAMVRAGTPAPPVPEERRRRRNSDARPSVTVVADCAAPFREPVRVASGKSRATVPACSGSDPVATIKSREPS